jgi:predicted peptidase
MTLNIIRLPSLFIVLLALLSCGVKNTGSHSLMSAEETDAWLEKNLDSVLQKKTFSASNGMQMPYRIFLPPGYNESKRYPLLVYLHGRGERGSDNRAKMFDGSGLFRGANSIISPNGQARFASVVIVPQCSDKSVDQEWAHWVGNSPEQPFAGLGEDGSYRQHPQPSESGAAALELIDSIIGNYAVDTARVYLTGISMGGFGAWDFATRRPDLFAAVVPMAGYSDPATAQRIKTIPVWVFHGDRDEYNPVEGSRNMVKVLRSLGAEVKYTEYPGLNHGQTFKEAWKNQDLLPWIFSKVLATESTE